MDFVEATVLGNHAAVRHPDTVLSGNGYAIQAQHLLHSRTIARAFIHLD